MRSQGCQFWLLVGMLGIVGEWCVGLILRGYHMRVYNRVGCFLGVRFGNCYSKFFVVSVVIAVAVIDVVVVVIVVIVLPVRAGLFLGWLTSLCTVLPYPAHNVSFRFHRIFVPVVYLVVVAWV